MNTFLAFRSLGYYIFSKHKNGHGIHSPFVYSLIKNVFENKTDNSIVSIVESSRKSFMSDRKIIEVLDLGAGSLKIKSRQRKVADIARYASVRPAYGKLLARLAANIDGKPIIELGTSLGIGTMYLALGAPGSKVITVEGCRNTANIARFNFRQHGLENIDLHISPFDEIFEEILKLNRKPGLVYIDGNHRSEALLKYIDILLPYTDEDTIVVLDDIHYSRDMEHAWKRIKKMQAPVLAIDILQFGLLFFRKGSRKQEFVIRY